MRIIDYFKLGGKNFRRNGYKTVLPVIIITIGIVIFNIMSGFFTSITSSTKETITDNNSLRFIQVSQKQGKDKEAIPSDFNSIKKIDGVLTSFPDVCSTTWIEHQGEEKATELVGVDTSAISYFTSGEQLSMKENELILSSALSKYFKKGSNVSIAYQVKTREEGGNIEGYQKKKVAKIHSFYDPFYLPAYPSEMHAISLASIDFVEQLNAEYEGLTVSQYRKRYPHNSGVVIAKTVEDVPVIGEKLEKMGYEASYALKSAEDIPSVAKIIAIIGGIVVLVLLLSSGVSIASIIGNSLRGRYKEIGVLRALGFERGHLIKLFSIEIAYIAFISFVSSVVLSILLMSGIQYMVNQKFMYGSNFTFVLGMDMNKVLLSLFLVVLVSFLASIRPIMKASSVNITEIIRGNAS